MMVYFKRRLDGFILPVDPRRDKQKWMELMADVDDWMYIGPDPPSSDPAPPDDPVNHPKHYTSHPSGIEVIQITEHMNFCLGNCVKYILRCDQKGKDVEDLKKARWYIEREIKRRTDDGK